MAENTATQAAPAKFDADELKRLQAEAQARRDEAAAKAAEAAEAEAQMKALVEEAAKPFRASHEKLIEQRNKLNQQYKEKLETIDKAIKDNLEKAESEGIPSVFVGVSKRAPRQSGSSGKGGGNGTRANLNLAELGEVGPVEVEAIKRTGNGTQTIKVTYRVFQDGDKMVAEGKYGETVKTGNLSIAASQAGWQNAHDVAYALVSAAGKLDEFPSIKPMNPASTIKVNGAPVPYRESESEQGAKDQGKTEETAV